MSIKATRMQAWALAGGGGKSRPSPPPPPPPPPSKIKKNILGLYWGPFCYFFFIWGRFCYVFLILRAFLLLFTSWWRPFFGLAPPPPLRKFLQAPMIARRVREHAPGIFFCVSSGHVLLRFCLKNDKNNNKL